VLGAIIGTKLDMFDPVGSIGQAVPGWFVIPFLLIAAVTLVALNVLNTYSSGLNLLALGVSVPRYLSVIFDVIVISGLVAVALFVTDFQSTYINFLSLTIWWLAPWAGIFLVDMFRRRFVYASTDFFRRNGGAYWYRAGINPNAMVAFVAGAACAALFTNSWSARSRRRSTAPTSASSSAHVSAAPSTGRSSDAAMMTAVVPARSVSRARLPRQSSTRCSRQGAAPTSASSPTLTPRRGEGSVARPRTPDQRARAMSPAVSKPSSAAARETAWLIGTQAMNRARTSGS
jgi:hypothetical protein